MTNATNVQIHELKRDQWHIGVLPATGASLAYGKIQHRGQWHNFMRPTPDADLATPNKTASYPLIPWSNRIRDGVFTYKGETFRLQPNWPDGTAIHGVARLYAWDVISADTSQIRLGYDSREYSGVNWPFSFAAEITYKLEDNVFSVDTQITNHDDRVMPAGFGHHPFFLKTLTTDQDRAQVQIPFVSAFAPEPGGVLPLYQAAEPVTSRTDFRELRTLPADRENILIDDCYTDRITGQAVRFVYPSGVEITLDSAPIFETLIFYCPSDKPVYAIEPVTNSNDGFNMLERGLPNHNVIELALAAIILVGFVIVLSGALGVNPADTVGTAVGNLNGDTALAGVIVIAVVTLIVYAVSRRRQ